MNNKINKIALTVGGLISVIGVAAHAAPGAYLQAQGGIGGMDTKKYSTTSNPTLSNPYSSVSLRDGLAYRLSTGYLFGDSNFNYGAELGFAKYPNNTYKGSVYNVTYKGDSIDLLGVAKYTFTTDGLSGFYAIGKGGIARVSQETNDSYSPVAGTTVTVADTTKNAIKPELAIGGGYDFNPNLSVDLTYNHIFAGKANPNPAASSANSVTKISSVNLLMAGLTYHFA